MIKKVTYATIGATFILTAALLARIDGGGGDTVGLFVLGAAMLFASADLPARSRTRGREAA